MKIKNWEKFQHYKNRKPPWIRLYNDLLVDPEFFALSGDAFKHLVMLWLIASEDPDMEGKLPAASVLAFRARITEQEMVKLLSELYHWVECDASNELPTRCQGAMPDQIRSDQSRDRGEGDAPARDQVQEDKGAGAIPGMIGDSLPDEDEADREAMLPPHPLVALCMELWPQWPQDQIEQSVLAWKSGKLNITEKVLLDAKASFNPREPYSRIHAWVARQAQFAARDAEKAATGPTVGRVQPKEFERTPDPVPPTVEEAAEIEKIRKDYHEKHSPPERVEEGTG